MNIVFAQIKKDIQTNRGFMNVWGAFLGINLFLPPLFLLFAKLVLGKHPIDFHSFGGQAMGLLFSLLLIYDLLVGVFLVLTVPFIAIGIVQQDMLVGTTAFWMTRPIPRGKLLAAKAMLIASVLLPFLLVIIAINAHYGGGHLWITVTAWITAFAAIASITSGFKQFIKYSVALYLLGKPFITAIVENLWTQCGGNNSSFYEWLSHQGFGILRSLHLNSTDLFHILYFIGLSIVFMHQYLTLERKRSLALLILVIAVVSLGKVALGPLGNS